MEPRLWPADRPSLPGAGAAKSLPEGADTDYDRTGLGFAPTGQVYPAFGERYLPPEGGAGFVLGTHKPLVPVDYGAYGLDALANAARETNNPAAGTLSALAATHNRTYPAAIDGDRTALRELTDADRDAVLLAGRNNEFGPLLAASLDTTKGYGADGTEAILPAALGLGAGLIGGYGFRRSTKKKAGHVTDYLPPDDGDLLLAIFCPRKSADDNGFDVQTPPVQQSAVQPGVLPWLQRNPWPVAAGAAGLGGLAGLMMAGKPKPKSTPNTVHPNTAPADDADDVGQGDGAKMATVVEPGGAVSRWTAATAGRVNPLSLVNLLVSGRNYHNPNTPERVAKTEELTRAMEAGSPGGELRNTVVRLGGKDLVDDLLWKRLRDGETGGFGARVGGRMWHNPRTSLLGKGLGTLTYGVTSPVTALTRMDHYDPYTDTAVLHGDQPAVTSHELGHAIDFNRPKIVSEKDPQTPGVINRVGRDAYAVSRVIPLMAIIQELRANTRSRAAIEAGMADNPEAKHQLLLQRDRVLPAGVGNYVGSYVGGSLGAATGLGGAATGLGSAAGTLAGIGTGKAFGYARAGLRDILEKPPAKKDVTPEPTGEKKAYIGQQYIQPIVDTVAQGGKELVNKGMETAGQAAGKVVSSELGKGVGNLPEQIGRYAANNPWAQYAMYGAPIGAGVGLLGGLMGRRRNKWKAIGDAMTGGLMGGAAGAAFGGAQQLLSTPKPDAGQPAPQPIPAAINAARGPLVPKFVGNVDTTKLTKNLAAAPLGIAGVVGEQFGRPTAEVLARENVQELAGAPNDLAAGVQARTMNALRADPVAAQAVADQFGQYGNALDYQKSMLGNRGLLGYAGADRQLQGAVDTRTPATPDEIALARTGVRNSYADLVKKMDAVLRPPTRVPDGVDPAQWTTPAVEAMGAPAAALGGLGMVGTGTATRDAILPDYQKFLDRQNEIAAAGADPSGAVVAPNATAFGGLGARQMTQATAGSFAARKLMENLRQQFRATPGSAFDDPVTEILTKLKTDPSALSKLKAGDKAIPFRAVAGADPEVLKRLDAALNANRLNVDELAKILRGKETLPAAVVGALPKALTNAKAVTSPGVGTADLYRSLDRSLPLQLRPGNRFYGGFRGHLTSPLNIVSNLAALAGRKTPYEYATGQSGLTPADDPAVAELLRRLDPNVLNAAEPPK